jgi:branched-chain amino acid transport system permease protein
VGAVEQPIRRAGTIAGPAIALVAVQLVFFPMPLGAWIRGVVIGLLIALLAIGLALVYRANRVINFAQADLGFVPTSLVVGLVVFWEWPWIAGLGIGIVAALLAGVIVELAIIRRFRNASRLVLTVATIGVTQLLAVLAILVPRWWGRSAASQRLPAPFELTWEIGSFVLSGNDVIALVIAPLAMAGVALFLNRTLLGVAVRAAAERSERAAMLGIPVGRLSTVVWGMAAVLSFLALFLRAGILGVPLGSALSITALVQALAALVIGRLVNLPAIAVTAVALGVLEYGVTWNMNSPLATAPIMATAVLVALLLQRRDVARAATDTTASWRSVDEVRPLPEAVRRQWPVRLTRAALVIIGLGFLAMLPTIFRVDQLIKANAIIVFAIIGLSLVVLTGWAGQISLGQMSFVAIGGAISAWTTVHWTLDLSLALVVAAAAGALAALVVGLPALRLQGLYLAVTTLAFALAVSSWLLNDRFFDWVPNRRLTRHPLFGQIDISTPTRFYVYSLIVFALVVVAVRGIRRSRTGRVIVALRENERAVQSFSVNAVRARLTAFTISGAIAGVAGGLFVHLTQSFDLASYGVGSSLDVFTATVVGGLGSLGGAVLGAVFLRGTQWFITSAEWRFLSSAVGVLLVLLILPGGLVSALVKARDALVRQFVRVPGEPDTADTETSALAAAATPAPSPVTPDEPDLLREGIPS